MWRRKGLGKREHTESDNGRWRWIDEILAEVGWRRDGKKKHMLTPLTFLRRLACRGGSTHDTLSAPSWEVNPPQPAIVVALTRPAPPAFSIHSQPS
jgi:hypothetical protein